MKKVLLLCFLGLGLAADGVSMAGGPLHEPLVPYRPFSLMPAFPAADYYRLCKGDVDSRGILNTKNMPDLRRPFPSDYLDYVMRGLDGALSVDGKLYPLDFGTNPELRHLARRLHGQRAILRGHVQVRHIPFSAAGDPAMLRAVEYVQVTSIEEVDEYIRETREVDAQGRFETNFTLSFDGKTATVLHVQGKTFVLDFSDFGCFPDFDRLNGKTLRVKGRLSEWREFDCPIPEPTKKKLIVPRYRVLRVRDFEVVDAGAYITQSGRVVEIGGPLQMYRHIMFGRGAVGIVVGGHNYYLDFGASDKLYALANTAFAANSRVKVTGTLRTSDSAIEVTSLEIVAPAEHYRETVSVEIKGFLQQAPRMSDVEELAIYPPFRALQVNVNGRILALHFPPDRALFTRAYEMVGSTVIIRGRLTGSTVDVTDVQLRRIPEGLFETIPVK